MPELPEVAFFKKYFEKNALKRKIVSVEIRNPKILRGISPEGLKKELAGRAFSAARQHGKYLFAKIEDAGWLIMHFGMTGSLKYSESKADESKYARMIIGFDEGGFLAYVNQRMIGWVGFTADPGEFISQKGIGPSALDKGLDFDEFKNRLLRKKRGVKPALMDQDFVAGIGNIYSDEILFQSRIHPGKKVRELNEKDLRTIFKKTKEVLRTAVERNADTEQFPEKYLLHDRKKGAKCPRCGHKWETMKFSGRTAFFCPKCQKPETSRSPAHDSDRATA